MKKPVLVLFAFSVGCAAGTLVQRAVPPARAQGQTGPSYEYWTIDCPKSEATAKAGREGWHLVSAVPLTRDGTTICSTWFFERQLTR
jgi:hypothetical protein